VYYDYKWYVKKCRNGIKTTDPLSFYIWETPMSMVLPFFFRPTTLQIDFANNNAATQSLVQSSIG
jgi:hypothetical protein